ncbi:MAG: hydrogenase nickel incorporation protein HypB [Sulfuricaulis sp.]|uniref:hydrogenase nickel incorporation protein HypB n=1 Tax=Sulfuricaulis sp. TaxID=2003553 RepID=UPI0025EBD4B3|nr:hydrogenase nickel incorporation protein HypB [Sulfuricaulis sp.]MCR4347100.1 hydrogenase nickel incorporation protein HypB [Sulfuricaulis sp.]
MCETCGCNITPGNEHLARQKNSQGQDAVTVLKNLLGANDQVASHNREHFDLHGVLALNLMSSPGSGKTLLLEATIEALKHKFRIAVIEGDLETENDAARIRAKGVPAVQITTGSACHLDAHMVHDALHHMKLADIDILFIENVGNLVCPASFDLGQHRNITLLSVTEGDDKPAKYPVMFRAADLVLLTKTDLLPALDDFDPDRAEHYLRQLANPAPVLRLSAKTKDGLDAWFDWLRQELLTQRQRARHGQSLRPAIQSDGARMHAEMAAHHSSPATSEKHPRYREA